MAIIERQRVTGPSSRRHDELARPGASLIDPQTLMRIKSLQVRARVAVEGFIKGIHRSPYHGFSVEFSEYREYSPGDDPRYLDWRLFARSDRYYVKRFEDETNLRCYLVVDTSRSMGYRSGSYSKSDYARTAAATIAYFLAMQRDAVGVLLFEDRITEYLPARYRPGHLRRLMAALEREPAGRATDLVQPLEEIAATVRKRGLIILISDLLAPADSLQTRLGYLRSRGHDVVVLRVLDPAEVEFPFTTPAMFHDVESGREIYVDPSAARQDYLGRFAAHAALIERSCVDMGIEYEPITTDRPLELVLFDLLESKDAARPSARPADCTGTGRCSMSFLTPLYILGVAAVAAPIVFHLIRRSPKGDVPFSSLMFLSPTPPRLTRRSRLDHWLLLLLRAAALSLLAFAFARPFLRQAAQLDFGDVEERRIALLVDTSASMRRGDLWPRAQALAGQVLSDCRPTDQLAVFAFDSTSRPLLSFHESATLDPARRQTIARAHLDRLAPTWRGTNLGQALVDTVAAIEDVADTSERTARIPRRVVLISDLSQGSRLEALGEFEWPSDVELDLKTVADTGSNAGLERLADQTESGPGESDVSRRVRVVNNPSSARDKFELTWSDEKGVATGKPIDVYVPPGESRVVRVPRPEASLTHPVLRLRGDAQAFDNALYFADERRGDVNVVFIGIDRRDDHEGLLYYLERVFVDTPQQSVHIVAHKPSERLDWDSKNPPQLVVVAAETPQNADGLGQYMTGGGTVLAVARAPGRAETLASLAEVSPWNIEEATLVRGDVMLGEIAFEHPLFASLAGAQFNDFTKIRFWKYRRIDGHRLGDSRVLARFENTDAAIIEKLIGKGRLVILASGWQPADSQLARSSKFVPLMSAFLESRNPRPVVAPNQRVGDRVPIPVADTVARPTVVHKPDGTSVTIAPQTASFDETDEPGLYTLDMPAGTMSFAVNLDPLESKTVPLPVETIEQFGVRLVNHSRKNVDRDQLRQMYNAELEGRQKLWRWLILAVIGILICETWLAGRTIDRPRSIRAEASTT